MPYWGKYVYHDNNRDINLSQMSMRAIADWYFTAHPPIMHDLHESQPLMYTYSGAAPQNPNLDPILFAELPWFSNFELAQMTKWGMPGVYTHAFMDGWSPGYLGSVAYNHNGMMRMYETQGGNDIRPGAAADAGRGGRGGPGRGAAAAAAPAAPAAAPAADADGAGRGARAGGPAAGPPTGRGGSQPREWYRGIPIPPGALNNWSRRNNANYMETGVLSGLQLAASFPNVVLENFYRKTQNSIDAGKTEAPYGYVLPVQRDMTRVAAMVDLLRVQRIEVGRATGDIKIGDATYPAGSYVIKRDQPVRPARQEPAREAGVPRSEPPHLRRQRLDDGPGDAGGREGDCRQGDSRRGHHAGHGRGTEGEGHRRPVPPASRLLTTAPPT